jgi:nicotinate-nucleotide pyrophosphorylase (carboxylating)
VQKEFRQIVWDASLRDDFRQLLRLALQEDLGSSGDCTTMALVPESAMGRAELVARQEGVVAGLPAAETALAEIDPRVHWEPSSADGDVVPPGGRLARVSGPAGSLLAAERIVLNLLGRLSGIATLTRRYVEAVCGTKARIFDTRKTVPAWRRLEKYAVRCGGGWNHRTGLFDAVLIKDNHLALGTQASGGGPRYRPAEAVRRARRWIVERGALSDDSQVIVEIEVDTLEQFMEVLPAGPDIVLLDNMTPAVLREAVAYRNSRFPEIELEASGGVNLHTVRAIAETGVERISAGALTHSAVALDIGLDWLLEP